MQASNAIYDTCTFFFCISIESTSGLLHFLLLATNGSSKSSSSRILNGVMSYSISTGCFDGLNRREDYLFIENSYLAAEHFNGCC